MSKYGKKLNKSLHDEDNVGMEFILIWNAAAVTLLVVLIFLETIGSCVAH